MRNHILHNFRTSAAFKDEPSDQFKDLHKLKPLTNFYINLTLFQGGVINCVKRLFTTPPGDDVRLTSKLVRSFSL